jgi:hypothetical protein
MPSSGWAYTRVAVPIDGSSHALTTEVAGDGRSRIRIRQTGATGSAPLDGALSYPAVWESGAWTGTATITVLPILSWGFELHVAVSPPASVLGRAAWGAHRLHRLAQDLATALGNAAERTAETRPATPKQRTLSLRSPGTATR